VSQNGESLTRMRQAANNEGNESAMILRSVCVQWLRLQAARAHFPRPDGQIRGSREWIETIPQVTGHRLRENRGSQGILEARFCGQKGIFRDWVGGQRQIWPVFLMLLPSLVYQTDDSHFSGMSHQTRRSRQCHRLTKTKRWINAVAIKPKE
jgi:hypothetical protein